jgi:hypothetical protein
VLVVLLLEDVSWVVLDNLVLEDIDRVLDIRLLEEVEMTIKLLVEEI